MKVRPSVKPICEKCKVIKRKGVIRVICENPLTVACGEGAVIINEIQPEGKKRMKSQDYVRGYRITTDTVFE